MTIQLLALHSPNNFAFDIPGKEIKIVCMLLPFFEYSASNNINAFLAYLSASGNKPSLTQHVAALLEQATRTSIKSALHSLLELLEC
mmetsp:Transcript_7715/g.11033  ORF Transcript_7715/g.11033 Transcript_7715/m.11033 type:complete len:87 (-) Transcript_7715:816-1076(-)